MTTKSCIFYCYKATNDINGKVYIGFGADPQKRWSQHKREAEAGRGFAFHAAIRKYGWAAFEFEVICCGRDKREMLDYIEPALIEQYQSRVNQNGYNVTRGGEQFPTHNRGGSKKGRIVSKESRLKMSVAKRGNSNGTGNKGRKHSEETKQKMVAAHLGHVVTEETRIKISTARKSKYKAEGCMNVEVHKSVFHTQTTVLQRDQRNLL